ncbi:MULTISPECIES: hypothetical protein [unclassified Sulfitobacter]|jgi:hypothetical protein|uniref:hypothetical protein n=1 Tax=unclassified Sulfitobacter TaxID=196795 RepID=UPI00159398C6|nr:hypothetical protein [Sulfitobacter sp. HGT1]
MRTFAVALLLATPVAAQDAPTKAQGLAAWDDIYAVTSHPRCTNCHVGADGIPMWDGLTYGADAVHGMHVLAGESRVGAETMPCRTCHIGAQSGNATPHAPPMIDDAWRLPPAELAWLGKSSDALCAQLRDPETNDGFAMDGLATHLETSAFVAWGFDPGAGRSVPPGTLDEMVVALNLWAAAGTPCASDP